MSKKKKCKIRFCMIVLLILCYCSIRYRGDEKRYIHHHLIVREMDMSVISLIPNLTMHLIAYFVPRKFY